MHPLVRAVWRQRCTRGLNASRAFVIVLVLLAFGLRPAHAQGTGYWHTSGNRIVDSNGEVVRIAGINWYGFETTDYLAHGLWAQDYKTILNTIKSLGFNVVRIPFSNQMVETNPIPSNYTTSVNGQAANSALVGQTALADLDTIVAYAGSIGLRVILDNHRSEAGNSNEPNGLWYTSAYSQANWIADWKTLATRYSASKFTFNGNPTVIGVDLRNEPHLIASGNSGACWTGDTAVSGSCSTSLTSQNWPVAAEGAGNAVLSINPKLLVFVEGTDCYDNTCGWQGGNLMGVASHPVVLSVAGQLAYSAHDYGPNLYNQSWFNSSTTQSSLDAIWNKFWGYISSDGAAPVWLGEFGTDNASADIESSTAGSQGQWFESLVAYLQANPSVQWTNWALNGEDSYGLLDSNYDATPVSAQKESMLRSIQSALGAGTPCAALPLAPTGLVATAASSSMINLSWNSVTPPTNCSISAYSVYGSTASGFTPSSANQVGSVTNGTAFSSSGLAAATTYYYKVEALDAKGASVASAQATAKTPAASAGFACHVGYSIVNQWPGGFQTAITLNNTGTTAITSWSLTWSFPNGQTITQLWNGAETQSGAAVTVKNVSYNGSIGAGVSYTGLGFTGAWNNSTNAAPVSFAINGTTCH
jgi:endoglucanase